MWEQFCCIKRIVSKLYVSWHNKGCSHAGLPDFLTEGCRQEHLIRSRCTCILYGLHIQSNNHRDPTKRSCLRPQQWCLPQGLDTKVTPVLFCLWCNWSIRGPFWWFIEVMRWGGGGCVLTLSYMICMDTLEHVYRFEPLLCITFIELIM